ncbi:hypothetical protein [Streptosporangium saharense]
MTDIQRAISRPERSREAGTRTTQAANRMTNRSGEFNVQEAEETPHG